MMGIILSLTPVRWFPPTGQAEDTGDTEQWFPKSRDWGGNPDQIPSQRDYHWKFAPLGAEYLAWFLPPCPVKCPFNFYFTRVKKSGQTFYLCDLWEL